MGFPPQPGVYLMKGEKGLILYVGKARNLRKRVVSYFRSSGDGRSHIRFLMEKVSRIEYLVTDTEKEALLLENTLIKKHRPRYNFNLRDDKTYFSLRIDLHEEFPRLTIIRKVPHDGARYFGPYSSGAAARAVLKQLYHIFPLRHYPIESCRKRKRPCLFFQMGQCSAPCHGHISAEEYAILVKGATLLLEGKNRELLAAYRTKMVEASRSERYEEAAKYRGIIHSIEVTVERQKMVTASGDSDVIGFHRNGNHLEVCVLFIRGGALIDYACYPLSWELDETEWLESFLNEYYGRDVLIPAEVIVPLPLESKTDLEELLSERRGGKVHISCASRGTKRELVILASRNAEAAADQAARRKESAEGVLTELRDRLFLARVPKRIECYDISNIQGSLAVGSCVAFTDGKPDKSKYRRYRIKTVAGADDFAMLREVLTRRFIRGLESGDLPDLILIDGGIGQLNAVTAVMKDMSITEVEAVSLAKSRVKGSSGDADIIKSDERVFLPGRKNPVVLRQNSAPLLLLARARNEAHRFAVTYHTELRGKTALGSPLDSIPGIGAKRKKILLKQFGSLTRLREATLDELRQTDGITSSVAEALYQTFHRDKKGDNL